MRKHHHKPNATVAESGMTSPATSMQMATTHDEKIHNGHLVSAQDIRLCAYQKWELAGKPVGDGVQFWLDAEHELCNGHHE